jgi:ComF family protein
MKNFFLFLLDTVLPPHQDILAVREIISLPSLQPRELAINNLRVTTLLPYPDKRVGACIRAVKYYHHAKATNLLSQVAKDYFQTLPSNVIIIPIPLSPARLRQRGYNQVVSILEVANAIYMKDVLTRTERSSQTALTRVERFKNMEGAMSVAPSMASSIEGQHILIVDDVVTTGATLAEAGRAIAIARPASVRYLALAH